VKKVSLTIFLILLFSTYTNKPLKAEIAGLQKAFDKIVGDVTQGTQNNSVQGSLLKKYGATSDITFYFFDASANYLQALEFLHRAYELNTEADKIKASLDYLKNSKSSESDRLSSTTKIIESTSVQIQSSIQDESYILSDIGRGHYEQAIPFAMLAGVSTYNFYRSAAATVKNLKSGNSGIESLLMNANNVVAIAKTLPELRGFMFNMQKTIKLILTGAKEKKIGDKNNVNKALNQLNLSDFDEPASFDAKKKEAKLVVKKEEPKLVVKEEEPKVVVKKKVVVKEEEPKSTVANADLERLLDLYNSGALTKEEFDLLTKNKKIERLTNLYESGAITKEELDLLINKAGKIEKKKEESKTVVKEEEPKAVVKKKVVVKEEEPKAVVKKKVVVKEEKSKNTDLENLTNLYNSGALTKEEFEKAKKLIQKTEIVEEKKEEPKLVVKKESNLSKEEMDTLDLNDQYLFAEDMKAYFFYIGPQKNPLKRRLSNKSYKKFTSNTEYLGSNIKNWNLAFDRNKVRLSKKLYRKIKDIGAGWSSATYRASSAVNLFEIRKSFYYKNKKNNLKELISEYIKHTDQESKKELLVKYLLQNYTNEVCEKEKKYSQIWYYNNCDDNAS